MQKIVLFKASLKAKNIWGKKIINLFEYVTHEFSSKFKEKYEKRTIRIILFC